jgi:uracil-DNA glycosylase
MVPGEGGAPADVMLVGEAPGATEDREGRPFCGRAGRLLDELLAEAGLERDRVYITNVVKARPPANRDPRAAEVAHWLPYLETELALVQPTLVVPLGRHALAHFAGGAKVSSVNGREIVVRGGVSISDVHGQEIVARGRTLFPMFHPAAGLRGTALRAVMFEDARKLRAALQR